ncbi:uncharacterized protein aknad1 isoform X1 [Xiphophorus couchianus]|uniref:uncharacterized protein aknad1 isoform X1 n=1 Tax=Xiphophorus couchianus TaxID=32473 RepID=UPI001015FD37|nr:protein AKNAD1 isoform X1 [Xiphophorus couchianus]
MEGDSEDEDIQGEDKPTVLWERCIQQSILVELSEDESIHLSDLESSLALHVSQAESAASEASIHLSGSAELSALEESSSESNVDRSNSVNAVENKNKSITLHLSAQRPNTIRDEPPSKPGIEDPGQDTSDEDHEDLPYDEDLRSSYLNQTSSPSGNSDGGKTVPGSPDSPGPLEKDKNTNTKPAESLNATNQIEIALPTDITHVLLRHFSQGELLGLERLIEAETLPEVSLLESVDDSMFSLAATTTTPGNFCCKSENTLEIGQKGSKNECLEEKTEKKIDDFASVATEENVSSSGSINQNRGNDSANETEQNKTREDDRNQRVPLIRTRSFCEMKYGQGQVHYRLPDFSKVAPKVKIPKTPSGPVRPVPPNPNTIHRAQSSPGMLELISRVLEDSIPPAELPYIFEDSKNQPPPAMVHHLRTEHDKLLTRYVDSVNLIEVMVPKPNIRPPSDEAEKQLKIGVETHPKYLASPLPLSENFIEKESESTRHTIVKKATRVLSNQHQDNLSDGERLTAELREIIIQFMQKVEEFKCNVTNMAVSTAEQQMMLRSMMEAQDELERKYISKKDEHRALEMQNYMGLSRNTGTFDPDRLIEGDIFRIGMHLEDIKEVIDRNTYEQISPPHSSSTPTTTTVSLHEKPGSLSFHTSSPPPAPSLHEGEIAGFSTESCKDDAQKDHSNQREVEDSTEERVNGGFNQSWEIRTADPLKETVKQPISNSHGLLGSVHRLHCQTAEDEQETILTYPSGSKCASTRIRLPLWTPDSSDLNTSSECDLGDCVCPAAARYCSSHPPRDSDSRSISQPAVNTSCLSQRISSPETDSGFGSSYLNQSATEAFQPNVLTGSIHSKCDDLNNSDSEASCSNLETTIHTVAVATNSSIKTLHCEAGAAAVELWVENTTQEPSVRLQRTDQIRLAHIPEPAFRTSMDTGDKHTPLNSCSCNSEAILALQTEVSKLKKDLEQGLVQLPHLAQRMDYLTSKYRQEDSDRTSNIQTHTPASKNLGKSSSRGRSNLTSSLERIDDWISSDMERSKSKDSGGGSCSEIMMQFPDSPVGGVFSTSELQDKLQHTRGTVGISGLKAQNERRVKQRPQVIKSFTSKERWSPSLQKPLLQVNYGSSCSLPASYKVREPQLLSTSCHRKHSTQSDTALLPSNVYFQQTLSPVSVPPRATSRRRGKKEEDMNRTLDQAIEVARIMKRTTDRIARKLSADLAKAQLHKKIYNTQPLGGRKHHTP